MAPTQPRTAVAIDGDLQWHHSVLRGAEKDLKTARTNLTLAKQSVEKLESDIAAKSGRETGQQRRQRSQLERNVSTKEATLNSRAAKVRDEKMKVRALEDELQRAKGRRSPKKSPPKEKSSRRASPPPANNEPEADDAMPPEDAMKAAAVSWRAVLVAKKTEGQKTVAGLTDEYRSKLKMVVHAYRRNGISFADNTISKPLSPQMVAYAIQNQIANSTGDVKLTTADGAEAVKAANCISTPKPNTGADSQSSSAENGPGIKRKAGQWDANVGAVSKKLKTRTITVPKGSTDGSATPDASRDEQNGNSNGIAPPSAKPARTAKGKSGSGVDAGSKRARKDPLKGTREKSNRVGKSHYREEPQSQPSFNGLVNHRNACFANATIQLINAALRYDRADELLGEEKERTEDFGFHYHNILAFNVKRHHGRLSRTLTTAQSTLRTRIKRVVKGDNPSKAGIDKHLRKLLADLDNENEVALPERRTVSPFVFQNVFAYGRREDADLDESTPSRHQQLNGDTQEDAFEYYTSIIEELKASRNISKATAVRDEFDFEVTRHEVCQNMKCDYQSNPTTQEPTPYCDVNLHGLTDADESKTLSDLIDEARTSELTGKDCPRCGQELLVSKIEYTKLPESVVVRINRIDGTGRKNFSAIDYSSKSVDIGGLTHEIVAMVMHRGRGINGGHYTVFRKDANGWWLVDDEKVSRVEEDAVKDTKKIQSALVLLKKASPEIPAHESGVDMNGGDEEEL